MIFEIIDQKQQCKNIVSNKQIISNPNYKELTKTWSYHPSLKEQNIDYAYLYSQGKSLDECCPDYLQEDWNKVKEKHKAYIRSFKEAKVDSGEHCFYDLVPPSFVIEYFSTKSKITEHVISTYNKPKDYDFLLELLKLTTDIKNRKVNIEPSAIKSMLHELKTRNFYSKVQSYSPYIDYNIFGTITGRLSTRKNSFPILSMNKDYRSVIKPSNDWFLEFDFNAAEFRCLLALNKQEQPEEDIHAWHQKIMSNLYNEELSREQIKKRVFGWLYRGENASLGIPQIEKCYNKTEVVLKHWNGDHVVNPYGRKIKSDRFHVLNYLIQSTSNDAFLRRAIAVNKLLSNRNSFTMGLIHDSMVIDFDRNDKDLLDALIKEFSNTDLGIFKTNVSVGTDFGNMRRFR